MGAAEREQFEAMEARGTDMNNTEVSYMEAVEQHFRQVRGSGSFILSPRDWALSRSTRGKKAYPD